MSILPNWHPIFVHFTVALLTVSALLFLQASVMRSAAWRANCLIAARWNLWIGALVSIGTVLAGWYAYNTVSHTELTHAAMTNHRNWALPTAATFILLAVWSFVRRNKEPGAIFLVCLLAATAALGVTGYKGGELVYRHGMGVMAVPVLADGHTHSHGDEHHHDSHTHTHEDTD